jgi:hypothetical protein
VLVKLKVHYHATLQIKGELPMKSELGNCWELRWVNTGNNGQQRTTWIPAFAGMTKGEAGMTDCVQFYY